MSNQGFQKFKMHERKDDAMRINLCNIGKLENAEVVIDGITVIAGENNTGKSTVNKALYAMLDTFYLIQNQLGVLVSSENALSDETIIQEIRNVSDDENIRSILTNKLHAEFNGQICNVFTDKNGTTALSVGENNIIAVVHDNRVEEIAVNGLSLLKEAVYIDDPFVLDNDTDSQRCVDHRMDLHRKLRKSGKDNRVADEIMAGKTFDQIISSVCDGELIINQRGEAVYHRSDDGKSLDIRNLSSGLKTFVVLKTLFENGVIENKGTIILDEPEIHLHPEWQLKLAEFIVLMQKQFDMHILLNTHSPYFLRALQVFAGKYGVAERCRYYLAESNGESAQINEVSDNIEKIYKKLYRPLQELENIEWNDD